MCKIWKSFEFESTNIFDVIFFDVETYKECDT